MRASRSFHSRPEWISAARKPSSRSASTWSFMSEMSGDTTNTVPSMMRAGIWNVSDLPAPVGITAMQSSPARTASMTSCWPGRNSS